MPTDTLETGTTELATDTGAASAPPPRASEHAATPAIPFWRYGVVVAMLLAMLPLVRMAEKSHAPDPWSHNVGLTKLPLQIGEWKGKNQELDKLSLSLLLPDDYVWRLYKDPVGNELDFLVVYGHLKQTFHEPGFCLPGGGWQILDSTEQPVSAGLPLRMNRFLLQHGEDKMVALYCFAQGDNATSSLLEHNMNLLRAHINHTRATGAFIRVIVPMPRGGNPDMAEERGKEFIQKMVPALRQRIG